MTQEEAEGHLAPYLLDIRTCIADAWDDWRQLLLLRPELASILSPRTRASYVSDQIVQKADTYFASVDVPTSTTKQFFSAIFADGRLAIRFKKFKDSQLHTSGIPTRQMLEIEGQQMTLDGMSLTYAVAGYRLDELGLDLTTVSIACSIKKSLVWQIELPAEDGGAAVPISTPVDPQGPQVRSTRPAVQEEHAEG